MKSLPYPPNDGLKADIWGRMQAMNHLGFSIDALIMAPRDAVDECSLGVVQRQVARLDFVDRLPRRKSVFTLAPTLVSANSTLASVALHSTYDITIADSDYVCEIFNNPLLRTKFRILRVHNEESKYMWQLAHAEENLAWKAFFALEALRFAFFKRREIDSLWFISARECEQFRRAHPVAERCAAWLPPSVDVTLPTTIQSSGTKRVLFVGGLKNPLNREGIRWYLENVHPRLLLEANYELCVAGNATSASAAEFVNQLTKYPRCNVHKDPVEIDSLYTEAALFVNPMRRGSGVKVKTIHAVQHQIPVVTTAVGAEGSGFVHVEHLRIADTAEEFAANILDLLQNRGEATQMASRAYQFLSDRYDTPANIKMLVDSLVQRGEGDGPSSDQRNGVE